MTANITKNHWNGQFELRFPHSTGTLFFSDINEAGKWVRSKGGQLGRIINGEVRSREAVFTSTKKLPKWAQA